MTGIQMTTDAVFSKLITALRGRERRGIELYRGAISIWGSPDDSRWRSKPEMFRRLLASYGTAPEETAPLCLLGVVWAVAELRPGREREISLAELGQACGFSPQETAGGISLNDAGVSPGRIANCLLRWRRSAPSSREVLDDVRAELKASGIDERRVAGHSIYGLLGRRAAAEQLSPKPMPKKLKPVETATACPRRSSPPPEYGPFLQPTMEPHHEVNSHRQAL
jgi:hypothetical protein